MKWIGDGKRRLGCALCVVFSFATLDAFSLGAGKPNQRQVSAYAVWNSQEVEAFSNCFFSQAMARWHIPGAAFVLVKDGKVIFAKGYGYANLENRIPVDPKRTVFRVASVSKVFTATAVMQLAEERKVNLHADVNQYLRSFKVPATYPQPVTLAELLTHSAGFDASVFGIAARRPSEVQPLGTFLARHMPERVMPPGKIYSYSSYGIALAGYIVQVASGEPFDAYIKRNILQPLDMGESSFRLTPRLAAHLATGYEYHKGRFIPEPIDYFNIVPAVGLYSTASEMAHFLIAHLGNGRYGNSRILSEAAAREMHRRQFTEDPRLAGRTYGFYERFINGQRAIGHGGNIRGFASLLMLVPKERVGFFVVFNRDESRFEDDLIRSFFDHFYPATKKRGAPVIDREPARDLQRLTGSYRSNPYSRHTFEKLITLYWQFRITANPDGSLEFRYPHDFRPPEPWVELAPLYFERGDQWHHAVFQASRSGKITHLFTDADSYEKLEWYEIAAFQVALVKILMLILLSGCVLWPMLAFIRRLRKRTGRAPRAGKRARWLAGVAAILNVFFILMLLHFFSQMDDWVFVYGVPKAIRLLLWIPVLASVLAAGMAGFAVWAWRGRWWSVWGRIHYTLVAIAALVFVWFFAYWNLLSFHI